MTIGKRKLQVQTVLWLTIHSRVPVCTLHLQLPHDLNRISAGNDGKMSASTNADVFSVMWFSYTQRTEIHSIRVGRIFDGWMRQWNNIEGNKPFILLETSDTWQPKCTSKETRQLHCPIIYPRTDSQWAKFQWIVDDDKRCRLYTVYIIHTPLPSNGVVILYCV